MSVGNNEPLPNPWARQQQQQQQQQQYRQRVGSLEDGGVPVVAAPVAVVYAVDGSPQTIPADACGGGVLGLCGASCCPCCVGGPCAAPRRAEYARLVRMLCFALSVVHVAMLVAALAVGGGFAPVAQNPDLGPHGSALVTLGAKECARIRWRLQVWRFATAVLLHAGVLHLLLNTWALLRMGVVFERRWGMPKTAALYACSGVGATLLSALLYPSTVSVGASGAICGLLGASAAELLFAWRTTDARVRTSTLVQTVFAIVVLLLIGTLPFIDAASHAGGVLVGFFLGCFVFGRGSNLILRRSAAIAVPWIALVLVCVYFVLGFALFFTVVDVPGQPTASSS